MSDKVAFPHQAGGKITTETRQKMNEAIERFGVTDGALVRMALEDYLPRYLAAQGQNEHVELFSKIGAALKARPDLAGDLDQLIKRGLRAGRKAA